MNVAVLGTGAGGRDITYACLRGGYDVTLYDTEATDVMDAVDSVQQRLTPDREADDECPNVDTPGDRLEGTTGLEAALTDADVVIETDTIDVGELQRRFADIETYVDSTTLVSTSRPEQSVTAATTGMRNPERTVGFNFVNPAVPAVVEMVVTEQTSDEATEQARTFVTGLDATPVVVRDTPGLASTRLTLALEAEAMRLVADGVASPDAVDSLLTRGFDHPVGPLERADRAGLDARLETLSHLTEAVGLRYQPPGLLEALVARGQTGKEAGEGFYVWEDEQPAGPAVGELESSHRK